MQFHVENFGCRATQADGAALAEELRTRGYQSTHNTRAADLVVLNTCTVTAAADEQARQYVRRVHRRNPRARIVVTGCYAQRAPQELAALPGVTLVVGNSHKPHIPSLVEQEARPAPNFVPLATLGTYGPPAKILSANILEQDVPVLAAPLLGANGRTRPTLKIQDGCNNRCAYCVIPFVRGRARSLRPEDVVARVEQLALQGYKEVVLSGVDLGSYGLDLEPRTGLPELTRRLLAETSIPLLRFSSLEPMDLSDDFLDQLAGTDRIARHLHAPLQSGSDRTLRAMRRWYTSAEYAERLEAAARALPNAGVGADVIVGFPGETEEDFRATCELVERLPFTYLHVFSYSPRPGTAAATRDGHLPAEVIRERHRALSGLAAWKAGEFRRRQLGRTVRALTLHATHRDGSRVALSENYLKLRAGALPPNELLPLRITGMAGELLEAEPLRPRERNSSAEKREGGTR